MSLTPEAEEAAKYLVKAKNDRVIDLYFELIDVTAGNETSISLANGLGIHSDDFVSPSIGSLQDLANNGLISIVEHNNGSGRKWSVQLSQNLQDHVDGSFVFPNTFGKPDIKLPMIFISYSRYDTQLTHRIADYLRQVFGYEKVWFDKELRGGQQWWDRIVDQIRECDNFIYLVSRESLESIYCRIELSEAWFHHKSIIPLDHKLHRYPKELKHFQFSPVNSEPTVVEIVSILASVIRPSEDTPLVAPNSLWSKHKISPSGEGITITLKVPATIEPKDDTNRHLCNTGILLIPGDEVEINASGTISNDSNKFKITPDGLYPHPDDNSVLAFYSNTEAYEMQGYLTPTTGNYGVTGTLFGWIGTDKTAIKQAFFVGSQFRKTLIQREEGFLHLAVNDSKEMYWDNEGEFDVDITITHPRE